MKLLILAAALAWANASAVSLYTVTVRLSQPFKEANISVFPADRALIKKYTSSQQGSTAVFKLPAGKYTFVTLPNVGGPITFAGGQIAGTVTKNTSFTIPVKPADTAAPLPGAALNAWNELLIAMKANSIKCPGPTSTGTCATVDSGFEVVKSYFGLSSAMRQVVPWTAFKGGFGAVFVVEGSRYMVLALTPEQYKTQLAFDYDPRN